MTMDGNEPASSLHLHFATSVADDRAVIVVTGELDPHTADRLTDTVAAQFLDASPAIVALDLSAVTFIDSTGLRAMLTAQRLVEDHGSRLVLRNPSERAQRLLQITQLAAHLDVES